VTEETGQRYELKFTATGEVRDADGNLLNQTPIEHTVIVTEDELRQHLEGQAQA
jgi:hypothetical protein